MKLASWMIALLLIFPIAGKVEAIQENGTFAIKTEKGILLAWNQPDNNFTLEVIGKEVRPDNSSANVFIMVDGRVLQVQAAKISDIYKDKSQNTPKVSEILISHRDWESEYLEGVLNKKLKVQSSPLKLKNGTEALSWSFDMPGPNTGEARKQVFLTAVNGKYVIVLNGVVTDDAKEETVKQFLMDTMATFKASPKPLDVEELQESIRKARP